MNRGEEDGSPKNLYLSCMYKNRYSNPSLTGPEFKLYRVSTLFHESFAVVVENAAKFYIIVVHSQNVVDKKKWK